MRSLYVEIPGAPVAQPRPRVTSFKDGQGNPRVRVYDPPAASKWKAETRYLIQVKFPNYKPMEGPISLRVIFYMPRPKTGWVSTQSRREKHLPHTKKPDLDNLVKSLKDALTGAVWKDDSQVCSLSMTKVYAKHSESPRIKVLVQEEVARQCMGELDERI